MNILDKIIEQKKLEINNARSTVSIEQLKKKKLFHRKVYSLKDFLPVIMRILLKPELTRSLYCVRILYWMNTSWWRQRQ